MHHFKTRIKDLWITSLQRHWKSGMKLINDCPYFWIIQGSTSDYFKNLIPIKFVCTKSLPIAFGRGLVRKGGASSKINPWVWFSFPLLFPNLKNLHVSFYFCWTSENRGNHNKILFAGKFWEKHKKHRSYWSWNLLVYSSQNHLKIARMTTYLQRDVFVKTFWNSIQVQENL